MPNLARVFMMKVHDPLRYCSRYLGKSVEKLDSSVKGPATLSSGVNGSICAKC
jgi:hypothetical protein